MVWAVPILLIGSGDLSAQNTVDSRVQKLEEVIQALERRVASLEQQLQKRDASSNANSANADWRKLKHGMSTADVEKILGSPSKVKEYGSFATWSYNSSSGYGTVRFRGNPRTLESWSEP
jgi:outer membrane protein assembly factor BamE (lipoprotein component of BamABCDE complex)